MDELQRQIDVLKQELEHLRDDLSISYRQNLRLISALQGTKTYYVATGATGPNQTPLKFKDGILTSET